MYIRKPLVGAALGLAVLGAAVRAEARIGDYQHGYGYGRSDSAGNNNYAASFSMSNTQLSRQLTGHTFDRQSYATQLLTVDTKLFGLARNIVYARTFAQAVQRVWGTDLTEPPE